MFKKVWLQRLTAEVVKHWSMHYDYTESVTFLNIAYYNY